MKNLVLTTRPELSRTRVIIRAYKKKFEILSSNSRTAALWTTYYGFIYLIKYFIRAERLHDFELHLAIVAKMLPIFAAAGRGQYSKALRLYLEQIHVLEIQYGALGKTFKVVGLHTVRYNEHEWSGVWTDLSIEQRLMKAAKSSGGLSEGRMQTHESAHKLWTATLNQMALINESVDEAIADLSNKRTTPKASSTNHSDLSKSSV